MVVRQWRHLKLLQRGGRAHDPEGVDGTKEGSLAVECPACPQPGRNLPEGWEDLPPEQRCVISVRLRCPSDAVLRWLYTLYLSVDANFKLRSKDRGAQDVYLGPGWAYVVEETKYKDHIKQFANTKEVRAWTAVTT